jgi:hypothetical protein
VRKRYSIVIRPIAVKRAVAYAEPHHKRAKRLHSTFPLVRRQATSPLAPRDGFPQPVSRFPETDLLDFPVSPLAVRVQRCSQ